MERREVESNNNIIDDWNTERSTFHSFILFSYQGAYEAGRKSVHVKVESGRASILWKDARPQEFSLQCCEVDEAIDRRESFRDLALGSCSAGP